MELTGVTACVPSHKGRGERLVQVLDALQAARRAAAVPTEIIVVDDSPQEEFARVDSHCAALGVQHLRGPRSAGAKRNLGARCSSFDVLLFVDSDCIAAADLIAAHLVALSQAPADVAGVIGRIVTPPEPSPMVLSRTYQESSDFARTYQEASWGPTGNLCIRRDVFDAVGGFDERTFTPAGGEDVDLGVRVCEAGYRWLVSPRPTVLHAIDSSTRFPHYLVKQFTYGRADVFLTSRHPSRRAWYANPVATGILGGLITAPFILAAPLLLAAAVSLPALAALSAEVMSSRNAGTPVQRRLLGALVDLSFDAGTVAQALRCARPQLAWRRFRYASGPEFQMRVRQP